MACSNPGPIALPPTRETPGRPERTRGDDERGHGRAAWLTPMTEQTWHTIVVRAWRDRDGLKIRFMAENANRLSTSVAVEATVESATLRFIDWLHSVDGAPPAAGDLATSAGQRGEDAGTTSAKTAGP